MLVYTAVLYLIKYHIKIAAWREEPVSPLPFKGIIDFLFQGIKPQGSERCSPLHHLLSGKKRKSSL